MRILAWYGNWNYSPEPEPAPDPPQKKRPVRPDPQPAPARPKQGLVVGRFLPPHAGHEYLISFARAYTENLTLVVQGASDDPIPASQRISWLEELFGGQPLLHFGPAEEKAWAEWVRHQVGQVDYLFGSEKGGGSWAKAIGAEYVLVDPDRRAVPVSGKDIRQKPFSCWRFIPSCVRPWFVRRVVLAGPEGSGKSTLAGELAEHFRTVWVREQAAELATQRGAALGANDLLRAARAQWSAEQSLARQADKVLFLDTDPLTARLWSERLYGESSAELQELAARGRYDLYLLLDPVDGASSEQVAFHERILEVLDAEKRPYCRVSGDWEQRFVRAYEAVQTLLVEPRLPAVVNNSP